MTGLALGGDRTRSSSTGVAVYVCIHTGVWTYIEICVCDLSIVGKQNR